MEPFLKKIPQERRNLLFAPILLGATLVSFLLVGFLTDAFLIALLLGPPMGAGSAYWLVGLPKRSKEPTRPLVDPKVRPWLFFPLAVLILGIVYVVLGVFLTPVLPPQILAYVTLAIAALVGGVAAYFLVGFPNVTRGAVEAWGRVPPEKRPWLFFPLTLVIGLVAYFLVGLALTPTPIPLSVQPLLVLPTALAIGAGSAYLLVGFPKPERPLRERLPDVPPSSRPLALGLTWLVVGVPLSVIAGAIVEGTLDLPTSLALPVALAMGYTLALLVAILVWGHPRRWRAQGGYEGGISDAVRRALFLPVLLLSVAAFAAGSSLAGLDLLPGALVGTLVGVPAAIRVSGLAINFGSTLPDVPDMLKPLVLLSVAGLVGGSIFVVGAYLLPGGTGWVILVALVAGLGAGLAVTERALVRDFLAERRRERARRAALERVRAERLNPKKPAAGGEEAKNDA